MSDKSRNIRGEVIDSILLGCWILFWITLIPGILGAFIGGILGPFIGFYKSYLFLWSLL